MVKSTYTYALVALIFLMTEKFPRGAADDSMKQMMGWANKVKPESSKPGGGGNKEAGGGENMLGGLMKMMGGKEGGDIMKMLFKNKEGGGTLVEMIMKSLSKGKDSNDAGAGVMKMFQGENGKKMMELGMKMMQDDSGKKVMEQGMKLLGDPKIQKMIQGVIASKTKT